MGIATVITPVSRFVILDLPVQKNVIIYNGSPKTPTWYNFDENQLTVTYSQSEYIDAGTYMATFTPKTNYRWADGTTAAKQIPFKIYRRMLGVPKLASGTIVYDGTEKTIQLAADSVWNPSGSPIDLEENEYFSIFGYKATNAGTHICYFTPKDNYCWNYGDNTAEETSVYALQWVIDKKPVAIPTVTNTALSYKFGITQGPKITGLDSNVTILQNSKEMNVGNYTMYIKLLNDNYKWSNDTVATLVHNWSISKATPDAKLVKIRDINNYRFNTSSELTFKITKPYDLTLSLTSSDPSVVSISLDEYDFIHITPLTTGIATLTIASVGDLNYNTNTIKEFNVSCYLPGDIFEILGATETNKWTVLDNYCRSSTVRNYLRVGDYFPVTIGSTEDYGSRMGDGKYIWGSTVETKGGVMQSIASTDGISTAKEFGFRDFEMYARLIGINHNADVEGTNVCHFALDLYKNPKNGNFYTIAFNEPFSVGETYKRFSHHIATKDCYKKEGYDTSSGAVQNTGAGPRMYDTNGVKVQNSGGWSCSNIRLRVLNYNPDPANDTGNVGSLEMMLPIGLRNIIQPVYKYSDNVGSRPEYSNSNYSDSQKNALRSAAVTATYDRLWLLSIFEIKTRSGSAFDRCNPYTEQKTSVYEIFENGIDVPRHLRYVPYGNHESGAEYGLESTDYVATNYFHARDAGGTGSVVDYGGHEAYINGTGTLCGTANYNRHYGIVPCFCI